MLRLGGRPQGGHGAAPAVPRQLHDAQVRGPGVGSPGRNPQADGLPGAGVLARDRPVRQGNHGEGRQLPLEHQAQVVGPDLPVEEAAPPAGDPHHPERLRVGDQDPRLRDGRAVTGAGLGRGDACQT